MLSLLFKMAAAIDHCHGFKLFPQPPRCNLFQSSSHIDYTMLNLTQTKPNQSLDQAFTFTITNIHKSFSTPCLSQSKDDHDPNNIPRIEIIAGSTLPRVRALVDEVSTAMASGAKPEPVSTGLGGAYFLRARNGHTIAVAKPIDEEPLAVNNPKGLAGRMLGQPGMKCSIRIGETGLRESAAYLLDHNGFSGVPPTALVRFSKVKFNTTDPSSSQDYKIASLQQFVSHDSDAGDLGPSSFSVTSVHHIGILDVRLMNLDRHAGNILVTQGHNSNYAVGMAELVPIDHGFCLPESLEDPYFEWLHWPQASIPFSEMEIDYVSCLDPYRDAQILRTELPTISESSVRVLVICTIFLKKAVAYGLCLSDIGEMMTRGFGREEENWSTLENLCMNVMEKGLSSCGDGDISEGGVDENEMFRLDNLDGSPTKCKPFKIPRFSSMNVLDDNSKLCHLNDKEQCLIDDIGDDRGNNLKGGGFMKSVSYSAPNYNLDGQCICFGEMDDAEWGLFLEGFEKALPEAFLERKTIGLSKHRLGNSCEF